MQGLRDVHAVWGYAAIVANGLSGIYALCAWRWRKLRGKAVWVAVIVAELALMVQVMMGAVLMTSGKYPGLKTLHMFYGFVAFITVGLLYSYQYVFRAKNRMELAYGLGGLFLMGVGIRGVLQVVGA